MEPCLTAQQLKDLSFEDKIDGPTYYTLMSAVQKGIQLNIRLILDEAESGHLTAVNAWALVQNAGPPRGPALKARVRVEARPGRARVVRLTKRGVVRPPKLRRANESRVEQPLSDGCPETQISCVTMKESTDVAFVGEHVLAGPKVLKSHDYGSAAGGHTQLCCYLALSRGDERRALALKETLAGPAQALKIRLTGKTGPGNFADRDCMADTEVLMAYARVHQTPVCVADYACKKLYYIIPERTRRSPVYLRLKNAHYTRLLDVDL